MSVDLPQDWGKTSALGEAAAATHDLRQAVRDYISEVDNPVPDYTHRRVLRNRLRELAGCPPEPSR